MRNPIRDGIGSANATPSSRRGSPFLSTAVLCLGVFAAVPANVRDAWAGAPPGNDYTKPENWLCRPGRNDACSADVATTVMHADGTFARETFHADPNAPIDCFYVMPTVSREPTPNSDMTLMPEEQEIAREQVARFSAKCRVYAPLYRQITLAGLAEEESGDVSEVDPVTPARDVLDSWESYLAHDNRGRGFVLIGHSQGSAILKQILAVAIDGQPIARQLVSALLPGTVIDVPQGKDFGGTFPTLRLCHAATDTGCVIAYSSFSANHPPGPDARFGWGSRPVMHDACVNPATLDGAITLDANLPAVGGEIAGRKIDTLFLSVPGLLSATCVSDAKHDYLAISIMDDRRTPAILPVLDAAAEHQGWGFHLLDINLVLGNLVDIVGQQSMAWLARSRADAGAK